MNLYAYDAAYAPNLAAVKAAGGIAINGYLTGKYATTTTQPAAARKAGLGYIPTYEEDNSELVGVTRAAGQNVGRKILAAFGRLGLPLDRTVAVYPSVDVNVPGASATACNAGWLGIRDIIATRIDVRAYAEGAVIDALAAAGLVDGPCWLSAPSSWPGYKPDDANVCMVQQVGTDVPGTDRNHLITDPGALGAWWPDGSPYGDDMLTAAQATQLANAARFSEASDVRAQRLEGTVGSLATGLAVALARVTELQTNVAALQAQLAARPPGTVTVTPTDLPVTGTVHIGSTQ